MADIVDVILRLRAEADINEIDKLGNKLKGIDKTVEDVARSSTKQRNLYKEQLTAIDLLRLREQRLIDLRAKSNDVGRIQRFNAELDKTRKAITSLTTSKPIALPSVPKQAAQSNGIGIGSIVGGGLISSAITGIAGGLKDIAGEVIDTTIEFEKFGAVLENSLGKQGGAEAFTLIKDFAKETPFQVSEITDSFIKLVNRGFTPTKEELTKIGDIASSQGKSFGQLTEAILDAQTGEFERLKEFGIKASKSGDQVSLSFKGVTKTVKNTDEAIRNAILGFGELPGILGANAKISETLGGQISNLKDNLSALGNNIGTAVSPLLKDMIALLNDGVGSINDFADGQGKLIDQFETEKLELEGAKIQLADVNTTQEQRVEIIQKLQSEYPLYLSNINAETVGNDALFSALNNVNAGLESKIRLLGAERNASKKKEEAVLNAAEIADLEGKVAQSRVNAFAFLSKETGKSVDKLVEDYSRLGFSAEQLNTVINRDVSSAIIKKQGGGFISPYDSRLVSENFQRGFFKLPVAQQLDEAKQAQSELVKASALATKQLTAQQAKDQVNADKIALNNILKTLSSINSIKELENGKSIAIRLKELDAEGKINARIQELNSAKLASQTSTSKKINNDAQQAAEKAKQIREQELKDFESFVKEKEKLQTEIDKLNLPTQDTEQGIAKRLELERKAEIKAIQEKLNDLKDKGKVSERIEKEAREVILKINQKYNLIETKDLKEFNEKKAKLLLELSDRINKDRDNIEVERLKLQEDSYNKEIKLLQFANRDRLAEIEKNFESERKAIEDERAKLTLPSPQEERLTQLELQNEKNQQEAKLNLLKEYEDKQRDITFKYFEQSIKDLEDSNKEQLEAIKLDYLVRETELNNSLNNGLISQKQYDKELRKLEDERAKDVSNNNINNLNKELNRINALIKVYENLNIVAGATGVTVPTLSPKQIEELKKQANEVGKQIAEAQNEASKPKGERASLGLKRLVESEDFKAVVSTITAVNEAFTSANEALQAQIDNIGTAIEKQASRVEKYRENADKGGAEQYKRELDRLNALEVEREKVLKRQRAIQKAQVIANQALAISNGIVAISEQATYPFPLNVIAIGATIASLVAGIAAAKQQLSANKFAKGTKYVTRGNNPIGVDTIPAYLNEGERVITTSQNKKYYDLYNKLEAEPNFAESLQKQLKFKAEPRQRQINLKSSTEAINQANNIKVVMANDTQALIRELRASRTEIVGVQNAINEKPVPSLNITSKGLNRVVTNFNKQNDIKKKL